MYHSLLKVKSNKAALLEIKPNNHLNNQKKKKKKNHLRIVISSIRVGAVSSVLEQLAVVLLVSF